MCMFCRSLFVLFLSAIVLSVLRFTDSDYPFGIFKLFYNNATFNNISVISWRSVFLVEEDGVSVKTTDLSKVTDKFYHIMLFQVHLALSEI
jgi:hypothetical protein